MATSTYALPDRQPPHAPDAEVSVLGGALIDGEALDAAAELVGPDDFYREAHRRIWRAMLRIRDRGDVVETVTVLEELRARGEIDATGGAVYLAELMDAVPTAANIEYHAAIVADRALRRKLIAAGNAIVRDGYEGAEIPAPELLDSAQRRVMEVALGLSSGSAVQVRRIMMPVFEDIERRTEAKGGVTGLSSGLPDLDAMTGGLQRGDLVYVAGRPGMGKTALVTGMALHAAIDRHAPVAFFSLEMSKEQLVQRMLCHEGLVNVLHLRRGQLADDDYARLARASGHLNTAPLWVDDTGGLTLHELRSRARKVKVEAGSLGMVAIDYIQLMKGSGENRNVEVGGISRGLKALAKELDVPIVALCQLSREPEKRGSQRPKMSDLRESGDLEADADLVLFPFRPEYYLTPGEAETKGLVGKVELIVGKQRNGPTGSVDAYFRAECARFESLTPRMGP